MSKKRICQNCGGPIPPERQSGAKYCKDSCKARYHEKKLMRELLNKESNSIVSGKEKNEKPEIKQPVINLSEQLRGVIDNTPKEETPKPLPESPKDVLSDDLKQIFESVIEDKQEEAPEYKKAFAKKAEEENKLKKILDVISKANEKLTMLNEILGQPLPQKKKMQWQSFSDAYLFYDDLESEYEQKLGKAMKQKSDCEKEIAVLKQGIVSAEKMIEPQKQKLKEAEETLKQTPQYIEVKKETLSHLPTLLESVKQNKIQEEQKMENSPVSEEKNLEQIEEQPPVKTNSRIISIQQLRKMQIKNLDLKGKWREFFGTPATIFHLVVHGNPGSGKSTFCFQLANYLAENHGKTIYISGEEGFSPTLKKKADEIQSNCENFFVANFKNAGEIIEDMEDIYPFIIIDSLNTMNINAAGLRKLREHFFQSTFITVCQSTKEGKMRGSQEIIHDADIVAGAVKGLATTSKNRFFETEKEYVIYTNKEKNKAESEKPKKQEMEMLRNVI